MLVEDVSGNPAEFVRIVELDADVEIKRTHRHLLADEQFFRLAQDLIPLLRIGLRRGIGDQFVVTRIAPARAVVAAARDKHVEKGIRIRIVADPAGPCDVIIKPAHRIEVDLPFLTQQLHVHPQQLAPHTLQFDRDGLVQLPLAVEIIHHGKATPFGKSRLGQKPLRLLHIASTTLPERLVAARARRHKAIGRQLPGPRDAVDDGLLVDDQTEGAAHPRIGERALGAVVAQEVGAEKGSGVEVVTFFDFGKKRRRNQALVHHQIGLTARVEIEGRVRLAHRNHLDGFHGNVVRIPITRIFAQPDAIIESP